MLVVCSTFYAAHSCTSYNITSCWPLTDGSDYIGIDETFTVGPGERRCFNITIVDDVVAERSESVHVLLTSAGPPHIFSHSLYFSVRDNDGEFYIMLDYNQN